MLGMLHTNEWPSPVSQDGPGTSSSEANEVRYDAQSYLLNSTKLQEDAEATLPPKVVQTGATLVAREKIQSSTINEATTQNL